MYEVEVGGSTSVLAFRGDDALACYSIAEHYVRAAHGTTNVEPPPAAQSRLDDLWQLLDNADFDWTMSIGLVSVHSF